MAATAPRACPPPPPEESELRDFMLVVRDALMVIVRYIERKYGVRQGPR